MIQNMLIVVAITSSASLCLILLAVGVSMRLRRSAMRCIRDEKLAEQTYERIRKELEAEANWHRGTPDVIRGGKQNDG